MSLPPTIVVRPDAPAPEVCPREGELQRRLRHAETLLAVAQAVGSTLDFPEVARRTTREMVRALGADMGGAMTLSAERDRLLPLAGYHLPKELFDTFTSTPSSLDYPLVEEARRVAGPLYATDSQGDPRFDHPLMRLVPHRSVLLVPMWVDDEIVGGFVVFWLQEPHHFQEDELRLVEGIARQAGTAFRHARLLADAQRGRREAEVAADLARAIGASLDLDTVLLRVAEAARELCGSDTSSLALRDPDGRGYRFRTMVGTHFARWDDVVVEPGRGAGGLVALTGRPLRTDDYLNDPRLSDDYRHLVTTERAAAMMVAPIRIEGEVAGLLYVDRWARRPFSDADEAVLVHLADHAAIAITNARHFGESERQRRFLESIAQASVDGIITADVEGRISFWSPGAEDILGYRAFEALGRSVADFYTGGLDEARAIMARLRVEERLRDYPLTVRTRDGRRVDASASLSLLRDPEGRITGTLGVLTDVTERLALEQQLRQAQKMEAVGRLAGGIAHDFNNLLTVILGRSQLLLRKVGDDPARDSLELIQGTAQQAAALTRQLLAFSRQQAVRPEVLSLSVVVGNMEQMLRRLLGEDIDLSITLGAIGCVTADPAQLDQVVMNLAVNARDAMPQGGRLSIETADVVLDRAYAQHHLRVEPGPYVMLAVSDTGAGMDAETLSHIFEPFFTTKEPGKGTGLGLAMVYGIVHQCGGHISVESAPGRGTTFRLHLPRVAAAPAAAAAPEVPARPRGSETILLVEDEARVLDLTREMLVEAGYTVLAASGPTEALRLAEERPERIDLLLTDVIMPQMNGTELAERLTARRPGLRVLYMSGYTFDTMARRDAARAAVSLLQKPFSMETLGEKVREVLDAA
jgi:PAS domain S-box-containing protein